MKHFIIFALILYLPNKALFAQFDIKVDPVAALISKNIKGGFEVGLTDYFALDLDGTYSPSVSIPYKNINFSQAKSTSFRLIGKFYLFPKYGLDRYYIGPYIKYRSSRSPLYRHKRLAMGIMSGYKIMLLRKFYIEIGSGLGFRVHASLQNNTGDFIDGITGTNFFDNAYNFFADSIGKYDITTRFVLGYRLSGDSRPRKVKEEKIYRP